MVELRRFEGKLPPKLLWEEKQPQTIHSPIPHYGKGYLDKTSSKPFKYCHHKVFQQKNQTSPKTKFRIYGKVREIREFSLRVCIAKHSRAEEDGMTSMHTRTYDFHYQRRVQHSRIELNVLANSHLSERQFHPMSMSEALGKNESFRN